MPKTVVISENWGGITDESRSETRVSFDKLQHFDLSKSTKALQPQRALEADDSGDKKIIRFEFANGQFYGFGVDSVGTKLTVYEKASNEITDPWTAATGGESSATGGAITGIPKHYKDYIYGVWNNDDVFEYGNITGTPTFTDAAMTLSIAAPTILTEPIIGKDDVLYIPYDNKLASIERTASGVTYTATVLTLPDNLKIRSMDRYGNYLAIGCSGDGLTVRSKMFLWNYIDADPTEVIDFGKEILYQIANLDGVMVGVSLSSGTSLKFAQNLVVREWSGGDKAVVAFSKDLGAIGFSILPQKFVEENNMYFAIAINSDTTTEQGIWSVGRKNKNYPLRVSQDILAVNNTAITLFNGLFKLGDYWWISHGTGGEIDRTNDNSSYSTTSLARSEIFRGTDEEIGFKKRLVRVGLVHEKLAGGSKVLKYRKGDETSYTTLMTSSTSGETSQYVTRTSGDAALPAEWNEIQFQLDSTGSEKILAIVFEYELMERR